MNETDHELLCRICLRNSCLCSDIYVTQSSRGNPIYEVINYVYDLEISIDDGLPKYVCQQCLGIVKEFENYKKNAHRTKRELLILREKNFIYVKTEEEDYSDNNKVHCATGGQIGKLQEVQKRKTEVCDNFNGPHTSRWSVDTNHGSVDCMEYANSHEAHVKQEPEEEEHWQYEESNCSSNDSRGLNDPRRDNIRIKDSEEVSETTTEAEENINNIAECAVVIKTESADDEEYVHSRYGSESRDESIDSIYPHGYINQGIEDSNSGYIGSDGCGPIGQRPFSLENHEEVGSGSSREDQYQCSRCGYVSFDQWHLKTHLCPDIGGEAFRCSYCDYRTSNSSNLTAHMTRHSGLKRYQCRECDFTAADRTHLKIHSYKHSGERPFKCHLCDYSTIDRTYLRNHMYKHSGEKPFKCHLCDYRAAVKSQLRPHMFTHTGEKRFECGLCDYRTAVKSNLKTHMYTHTGERPFQCQLCDYKCSNSSALKAHIRTHTGEKPFKCNFCDYSATTKSCFKKHVEKHNGDLPQGSW